MTGIIEHVAESVQRIVHPPIAEHSRLRQPMTSGEKTVFDLFDLNLAPEWEIYIQPHLNGLRPDFVLLNPFVGIAVYEVKDWNLDAMDYFVKRHPVTGKPSLWAQKDENSFNHQSQNPITKVNLYRNEIFNLYCPRLEAKLGFAAITAGVIFPFADGGRVKKLLKPFLQAEINEKFGQYQPVCGREHMVPEHIKQILPSSQHKWSKLMNEDKAQDLRGWLIEPDFAATQRQALELDSSQRQLSESRTATGYRRIRGPAGSGKSLVLAATAARLMNEDKSVLIATFNITLWHYLRDLIVRGLDEPRRINNAEFTHFHRWCKNLCVQVGWGDRYEKLLAEGTLENFLDVSLPALASEAADLPEATLYDAILVDEGQDFRLAWWNSLRKVLKPDGEILLVADATQDVYGTAKAWTEEAMTGAGFAGGRWAQLRTSYRLPVVLQEVTREFAQQFLPQELVNLPVAQQQSLDYDNCSLRWVQCDPHEAEDCCISAIRDMIRTASKSQLAISDIVFLTDKLSLGARVVDVLQKNGVKAVHTFEADKLERQRQKIGFWMGDAKIKATTLHSFKGWEARLLIVHIGNAATVESCALVYAGLTRLKQHQNGSALTVVSTAPELADYGRTWAKYSVAK